LRAAFHLAASSSAEQVPPLRCARAMHHSTSAEFSVCLRRLMYPFLGSPPYLPEQERHTAGEADQHDDPKRPQDFPTGCTSGAFRTRGQYMRRTHNIRPRLLR
jgi:hypothetical protein